MALERSSDLADRFISPLLSRLDLSPLHGRCLLQSDVRRETYDCIASELCDYGLSWQGGAVDARAYAASTGRISICEIQYGDEVSIRPRLYDGFMLARVSLRNAIEVESDGSFTHMPEGTVFFSAPQRSVTLRWQAQCRQLLIRLPTDVLKQNVPRKRGPRKSGCVLDPALTPLFLDQVNLALGIAGRQSELANADEWIGHVETGLAQFAAMHLFGAASRTAEELPTRRMSRDWPERLQAFIRSRLKSPLMLDDLTRALNIGRSQLNAICHDVFECSPMQLVRLLRLQAARGDLEQHPNQDLTVLALRYGFEHQSRFSQYYKQRYHELPRDTRRRLLR